MIHMNLLTKQRERLMDTENKLRELIVAGGGRVVGRDNSGVWDGHAHTATFNMGNQQGPALQHMELCSLLCGRLGEGSLGENGYTHMYG